MDSKFTKDMAPPTTATCWRLWVRANSTAAISADAATKKKKKSWSFEARVGEALRRQGWQLLFHDVLLLGVQIDLLMKNPGGLLTLIEVKSQNRGSMAHLPWRQRR